MQTFIQRRGPPRGAADQNKKRNKKMNGLIKQTKLDGLTSFGSLAIALFSVASVLYVMAAGAIA